MSIEYLNSSIQRIQRELQQLQDGAAQEARKEAQLTERTHRLQSEVSRATSASAVTSKLAEIARVNADIVSLQKRKADIGHKIAKATQTLFKAQQDLSKLHEKERSSLMTSLKRQVDDMKRSQAQALRPFFSRPVTTPPLLSIDRTTYDAFICHASEDKEDLARPLAEGLVARGHKIWFDELQLRVGDSLRRSIDKGLSKSRFGIVILSPSFFAKNWPQYELDGLVAKEIVGGKVILPIWHRVSKDDVIGYSPTLADRVALSTSVLSLAELIEQLAEALAASDT